MATNKILNIAPLGFPWATQDPFLFCAYHKDNYPQGNDALGPATSLEGRNIGQDFTLKDGWRMYHGKQVPGFPYHPHRGFETISIVKEGLIDHSDSLGATGRFGKGDVQWMTAGKGVLHAEMFPLTKKAKRNEVEMFQVWLNLPKASKFVEPHYKMLWQEQIPSITLKDTAGKQTSIELIAGSLQQEQAPAPTPNSWANAPENAVRVMTIKLEQGAQWTLPATLASANRTLYFYQGNQLDIAGKTVFVEHSIQLQSDADIALQAIDQDAYLLLLEGKPIAEPVVQYGPFVMNSKEEIQQAFEDYRRTQFGGWPWDTDEPTHSAEQERFALYADGRKELK